MRAVTRAAEGYDRRAFTVSEILRVQETGILVENEKFELIGGEIVPVPRRTHAHELMKSALLIGIGKALPDALWMSVHSPFYLSDDTLLKPEIAVFPRGAQLESLRGPDVLLAVDVLGANRSYSFDFKPRLYARHKFRELWLVDPETRVTHRLSSPAGQSWRERSATGPDEILTPPALPGFSIRLSDY